MYYPLSSLNRSSTYHFIRQHGNTRVSEHTLYIIYYIICTYNIYAYSLARIILWKLSETRLRSFVLILHIYFRILPYTYIYISWHIVIRLTHECCPCELINIFFTDRHSVIIYINFILKISAENNNYWSKINILTSSINVQIT